MKEMCLIDADIIGYRVGFTTQDTSEEIAHVRTDELIRRIAHQTEAKDYQCFLSGEDNFRYLLYPEYKGNRIGKPKPIHLEAIREHIVRYHSGKIINGREADDELCIEHAARGEGSIIASIDKDLLQSPGWHFNFVKEVVTYVTPLDGLRAFYTQVIAGDGADNIPSYDGKVRNQVPQFIQRLIMPLYEMTDEQTMYDYVRDVYLESCIGNQEDDYALKDMHRNAKLLYLMRREGDFWLPPGQRHDTRPL